MVSVTSTLFCHYSVKAARRQYLSEWVSLCSNKTLLTKTGGQPMGCSLLTSALDQHCPVEMQAIYVILNVW